MVATIRRCTALTARAFVIDAQTPRHRGPVADVASDVDRRCGSDRCGVVGLQLVRQQLIEQGAPFRRDLQPDADLFVAVL